MAGRIDHPLSDFWKFFWLALHTRALNVGKTLHGYNKPGHHERLEPILTAFSPA